MIGVLIVSHGTLGESLVHCAAHVMGGEVPGLEQVNVTARDDPNAVLPNIRERVRRLDDGNGVLILSDIYGATPSNIVCRLLEPGRVEGISGVNLPMLIRALTYRNEPLPVMVEKALSGGHEGILHITREVCRVA
jgi:PTS system ascorbate-specific IIA component